MEDHYDVIVSLTPTMCGCGQYIYRGDVFFLKAIEPKRHAGHIHCMSCAVSMGAPAVPAKIVESSMRSTREYFCHAMAAALVAEPTGATAIEV